MKNNTKELLEVAQSVVTISAIVAGGIWTYLLVIKERKFLPHANIEHKVSHIPLSSETNLLTIELQLTNSGSSELVSNLSRIRIQQILPVVPCKQSEICAKGEIADDLVSTARKRDTFPWTLIGHRESKVPIVIEPGETDKIPYEFAVPESISHVRVYTYIQNDKVRPVVGWSKASYYNFKSPINPHE